MTSPSPVVSADDPELVSRDHGVSDDDDDVWE